MDNSHVEVLDRAEVFSTLMGDRLVQCLSIGVSHHLRSHHPKDPVHLYIMLIWWPLSCGPTRDNSKCRILRQSTPRCRHWQLQYSSALSVKLVTFLFMAIAQSIEILIKFLEKIPQIPSVATNVIKLPFQKMADTSKDELLLGGGIHHITAT